MVLMPNSRAQKNVWLEVTAGYRFEFIARPTTS